MEIRQINMCNVSVFDFGRGMVLCKWSMKALTKFVVGYKINHVILYTNIKHRYPLLVVFLEKVAHDRRVFDD